MKIRKFHARSLLVVISENFWIPITVAGVAFKGKPRNEDRLFQGFRNREVTKYHKQRERQSGRYQSWYGTGV